MCIVSFGAELITKLEFSYKCTLYFGFDEWSFKTCSASVLNVFCQLDIEYTHLDCWYFCASIYVSA